MNAVVEWALWGAHFLLWFGLVALVEVASYWFLRAPWERLRRLRVWVVSVYLVVGVPIVCFMLFAGAPLSIGIIGALVFFSFLQTLLENATLPRNLDWRDQFYLSLLTHYYSLCNGILFVILLLMALAWSRRAFGAAFSSSDVPTFLAGTLAGLWLTPVSISFFRWLIPQLQMRPGVDRSLDENESVR